MTPGLSGRLTRATIRSKLTPIFLVAALAAGLIALFAIPREEEPLRWWTFEALRLRNA